MHTVRAPIGLASFVEHDNASRTTRDNPRSQGVVEALDVRGVPSQCADRAGLRRGNHPCVCDVWIGVACGVLTGRVRHLGSQALGTRAAAIPDVARHHWVGGGMHGDPSPRRMGVRLDTTGHRIGFHFQFQASPHHRLVARDLRGVPLIGQRLNARDEQARSPLQTHTNRPAHASQGDPLQQQACNHGAWLDLHQVWGRALDPLAPTCLALRGLFAVVHMTMLRVSRRSARWPRVPPDHRALVTSTASVARWPIIARTGHENILRSARPTDEPLQGSSPRTAGTNSPACGALPGCLRGDGWMVSQPLPWATTPRRAARYRPSRPPV
jgi:hypothetical protein